MWQIIGANGYAASCFLRRKKRVRKKTPHIYTPIYDLKETRDLELKWLKIQEWVRTSAGMTNNNNHQHQGVREFLIVSPCVSEGSTSSNI